MKKAGFGGKNLTQAPTQATQDVYEVLTAHSSLGLGITIIALLWKTPAIFRFDKKQAEKASDKS